MRTKLRSLVFGIATALVSAVSAQYPYYVTVSGHVNQCNPVIAGGHVTIVSGDGAEPTYVLEVELNENCYYTHTFGTFTAASTFSVYGSCMNGTSTNNSGSYTADTIDPVFVTLDLTCEALEDCEGEVGGTALPGTPCDDGDPGTFFDSWSPGCQCLGGPDEDNYITVSGTVIGCTGAGMPVRIIGAGTPWVDEIVYTDANCGYTYTFYSIGETGMIEVNASCDGGITMNIENAPWTMNPSSVTIDLECQNTTTYNVTVQGSVSPCELLDNTVTVRCTSCIPWVETSVPVDANCNYSTVLNVPDQTGTIVVATGCSNGSVPNNTTQYIVNSGQTGTMITLLLTCAPAPGEACFTVEQTEPFVGQFTNCSTGCLPPFTFVWDFSGPSGGTQEGDSISYTFPGPGTYAVCLNVTGLDQCIASTCQEVIVDANGTINPSTTDPCEADFWVIQAYQNNDTIGGEPIPNELWIWNLSSGGTGNFQFLWSFGDGTSSSEPFPSHTYEANGPYTLCLTMTDDAGCSSTHCQDISIDDDGFIDGMILEGGVHTVQGPRSLGFTINVINPLTMAVPELADLTELNLWPNPTQDRLDVMFNSVKSGQVRTEVVDMNGRRVAGTMHQLVHGKNRIQLEVSDLPAGMYLLRIGEGAQNVVQRFVKAD